jgi:hypothetical protein
VASADNNTVATLPAPPPPVPQAMTNVPAPRKVSGLTTALVVLMSIATGTSALALGLRINLLVALDDARIPGGDVGIVELIEIEDAYNASVVTQSLNMVVALAILILLIIWTYRIRSNVGAWRASNARLPTGMAIGSWFIPFFWWLGPYWCMSDGYKAADPALEPGDDLRRFKRSGLALVWWIFFSAATVLSWIGVTALNVTSTADDVPVAINLADNLDTAIAATSVLAAGDFLLIPAALLGLLAISKMGRRQRERAARQVTDHAPSTVT